MNKKNTDHVVIRTGTNLFECKHCGQTYQPNLPASINIFVAMLNSFVNDHRDCKAKEGGPNFIFLSGDANPIPGITADDRRFLVAPGGKAGQSSENSEPKTANGILS